MSLAEVVLIIIWVGVSAYGVFGGADFGGGMWDLVAGPAERGAAPRRLIERSIGPVWEANHVWLIFILVYLWTGFPRAFTAIAVTMYIPLTLAALGIILRGSGFAFRKWARNTEQARFWGAMFAGASLITPFFLGTIAGGVASGRVPSVVGDGDPITSWLNPTSILGGVMAVVMCAFLAAVLLAREAERGHDQDLVTYFRRRALVAGTIAGASTFIGIWVLRADAPDLFDGLTSLPDAVVIGISVIAGLSTLALLSRHAHGTARVTATFATVAILWGWAVGQYPDVLPGYLTIDQAAASDAALIALIGAFVLAGAIAVPALLFLFKLTEEGMLAEGSVASSASTAALLDRLSAESSGSQGADEPGA